MSRGAKESVEAALRSDRWPESLESLRARVSRALVSRAVGALCHQETAVRWRAVEAVGVLVSELAKMDYEAARDVIRRLMWSLNEESGSIGWGAPEAVAEVMARDPRLAGEFLQIYLSNLKRGALESMPSPLREGFLWGVKRLWDVYPEEILGQGLVSHIVPSLSSQSGATRGLAAALLGVLGAHESVSRIMGLTQDATSFELLQGGEVVSRSVSEVAREALWRLAGGG